MKTGLVTGFLTILSFNAMALDICNSKAFLRFNTIAMSTQGKHVILAYEQCKPLENGMQYCDSFEATYFIQNSHAPIPWTTNYDLVKEDGMGPEELTLKEDIRNTRCAPRAQPCTKITTYTVIEGQDKNLFTCTH